MLYAIVWNLGDRGEEAGLNSCDLGDERGETLWLCEESLRRERSAKLAVNLSSSAESGGDTANECCCKLGIEGVCLGEGGS